MSRRSFGFVLVLFSLAAAPLRAQQPPSYARQVKPFLARYCVECHNADKARGELDLSSYKTALIGGKNGPAFVAAKPDESVLVRLTEGKDEPKMPPKNHKAQPTSSEVALLRSWVAAGARDDSAGAAALPAVAAAPSHPPVAALAYAPRGSPLAVGGHDEALLLDPATGAVRTRLHGQAGKVTAVAFDRRGETLAVASGRMGASGTVRLYFVPPSGVPAGKPEAVLDAHKDAVLGLAFSPDGNTLATAGYDRLVALWDVVSGTRRLTLKDHSDSVYAVSFRPDGALLASGGADRAVKVWEVATGKLLYTLPESTDWVYAVAWHPDGKHLAAAGVDKSIRVWRADAAGGKVVHSVFAHEGPVTRLAYAADGSTLYSLGEDRTAKAWDTATMREKRVYPKQPEATLALAVRADRQQIALGRYDGGVVLLEEATGKIVSEPLPLKPALKKLTPPTAPRGQPVRFTFEGDHLDLVTEVTSSLPGVKATLVTEGRTPRTLLADVTFPADAPAGVATIGLKAPLSTMSSLPCIVDLFNVRNETEPNDSPTTGQKVTLPTSVVGIIGRAGETDFYRFDAPAGAEVGVQVLTSAVGSKLDAALVLSDATGRIVAEGRDNVLGYRCPAAGTYAVGVRDREYRGGADMTYRLHIGAIPVVTSVFPLGLRRGSETEVVVEGVHLGSTKSVKVKAPADAPSRLSLPLTTRGVLGVPQLAVGEFEETRDPRKLLPVPGTANGRLADTGAASVWRFAAKKGQRLIVEVEARRLGSLLDSTIEILDAEGNPVPRATLRAVAKTYTTFRDHDATGSGIRIEHWTELAMRDTLLVGSELLRIRELPKNPDDDCQFESVGGQRHGLLDTTPTHHPLGEPMYKVTIHPPGMSFPPNGFPLVTLPYRNDDGGAGLGKDSRLTFDAPEDGIYGVRLADARGNGGNDYSYRLTVRPPQPDFRVRLSPEAPQVWKGGAVPVTVNVERLDGFDGRVDVRLENLPPGFRAPATNVLSDDTSTTVALSADANAVNPSAKAPKLKVVARATVDGKEIVRETTGGHPKVMDGGDIVTTVEQTGVTLRPGGEVRLTVRIKRQNGFKGRIPIEVRGLPYGVRVLDIGLNGILITEGETVRTMVLYAEPWVAPAAHPIVVLAKREGKTTEHAAPSVLLTIVR